jgi:hypothetical protein
MSHPNAAKTDIVLFNLWRRRRQRLRRLDGVHMMMIMRRTAGHRRPSSGRAAAATCGPAGVHLSTLSHHALAAAVGALCAVRRLVHGVGAAGAAASARHTRVVVIAIVRLSAR